MNIFVNIYISPINSSKSFQVFKGGKKKIKSHIINSIFRFLEIGNLPSIGSF